MLDMNTWFKEVENKQEELAQIEFNKYIEELHDRKIKEKQHPKTDSDCGDCDPSDFPFCNKCIGA